MLVDVTALSHEQLIALYIKREQEIATSQQQYQERLADRDAKLAEYEYRIAKLEQMLFGKTRERFIVPDGQQVLPMLVDTEQVARAAEAERATIVAEHTRTAKKQHPGRLALPEHLRVVETIIEPEIDTSGLRCIGTEVTDELGYTPAELFIKRTIRPKYVSAEADDASQHVYIAPLPRRAISKCIASTELLAAIITDKHLSHLPVYRQLERFRALGVDIQRSTADNWQRLAGHVLRPLYAALGALVPQASYLQVDESEIKVQDRAKKGVTHRGYMWVYHAPIDRLIYFDYQRGRGAVHCQKMLGEYCGYLQTDAYDAYEKHKARDAVTPLGCWAHARRKFYDAQTNDLDRSQHALRLIARLYDVEREARSLAMIADERKELRLQKSLPVLNEFNAWVASEVNATTPKSPIGVAMRYAMALYDELDTYLLDGNLEIDNNLIENAIRPLALGRKNYLFAGSHDAAINIAMYRSFFATCNLHQIDPRKWLVYVLNHIEPIDPDESPDNIDPAKYLPLLPHRIDRALLD